MEVNKKTSLLIATAMFLSMMVVPVTNVFATDNIEQQIVQSEVLIESPFANVDYSDTALVDYTKELKLTNATVKIESRERIENAIKAIEDINKGEKLDSYLFENEYIYFKSLLLKIDSLEEEKTEEFHKLYSQYIDINIVSSSDMFDVSSVDFFKVSEMLELYYSYNDSIQSKIYNINPEIFGEYIAIFKSYSDERNDYLEKYQDLFAKNLDDISLADRDTIINAVADFEIMSKANQGVLSGERSKLDSIMSKYLALKEAESKKTESENKNANVVSNSNLDKVEQVKSVVSNSDVVLSSEITSQDNKDNDIGYDVYDTGDISFTEIKLTLDMMCISFFLIVLMLLLINQYVDLFTCKTVAIEILGIVYGKYVNSYTEINEKISSFRTIGFDELSEDFSDRLVNKIKTFKRKHERINRIKIIE